MLALSSPEGSHSLAKRKGTENWLTWVTKKMALMSPSWYMSTTGKRCWAVKDRRPSFLRVSRKQRQLMPSKHDPRCQPCSFAAISLTGMTTEYSLSPVGFTMSVSLTAASSFWPEQRIAPLRRATSTRRYGRSCMSVGARGAVVAEACCSIGTTANHGHTHACRPVQSTIGVCFVLPSFRSVHAYPKFGLHSLLHLCQPLIVGSLAHRQLSVLEEGSFHALLSEVLVTRAKRGELSGSRCHHCRSCCFPHGSTGNVEGETSLSWLRPESDGFQKTCLFCLWGSARMLAHELSFDSPMLSRLAGTAGTVLGASTEAKVESLCLGSQGLRSSIMLHWHNFMGVAFPRDDRMMA